jgi:glycosyltransferase involved in cell wall biosynthesis
MRILLASEEITSKPREGSLVFLMHLCRFLRNEGELTVLHAVGEPAPDVRAFKALSPKTLFTRDLIRIVREHRFDIVLYVPQSGLTAFGLARGALLRFLTKAPTITIGLQARSIGPPNRFLAIFGKPDLVLSPVPATRERLERLGFDTGFIIPGFDEHVFKPVSPELRARLKIKYQFPAGRFILLHVGHIRESRNVGVFLRYRDWGADVQPVIKAGNIDSSWVRRLRMAGVIVIDEYVENVHELYQASDCYLFPVASPTGAIEFPLSVIEACACNLPVITTRFGALPDSIREGNGFQYYTRASEIGPKIAAIRESTCSTAANVRDFSWESVFRKYLWPPMRSLVRDSREGRAL